MDAPPELRFVLNVERSVRDAIAKELISASHRVLHAARVDGGAFKLNGGVVQRPALAANKE